MAYVLFIIIIGSISLIIISYINSDSDPNVKDGVARYSDTTGGVRGSKGHDLVSYDTEAKTVTINLDGKNARHYKFSDILQCEIIEDERSVVKYSTSGAIGGAILGGLIAGKAGAMIGSMRSTPYIEDKVYQVKVRIIVNDPNNPICDIFYLISIFGELRGSYRHENALTAAENVCAIMDGIIIEGEEMREIEAQQKIIQATKKKSRKSNADELVKLKSLLDSGVLTQEEFDVEKKKVLSR